MQKSDKKPSMLQAEEAELNTEELENVNGGAHPGGANQIAQNGLGDGSVRPADGSKQALIGLLKPVK